MFVLRKITSDNAEINFDLGESYTLLREEWNSEEFNKVKSKYQWENYIYAFVTSKNFDLIPLSKNEKVNLILTGTGETFEKP